MSIWKEIRNNNFDENERCITIDAWKTNNDNEEGKVIAKVYEDGNIGTVYIDKRAITDNEAQIAIEEAIGRFEAFPEYYKNCY